MGGSCAILCGVDMGTAAGDNHALDQHTEFHGFQAKEVYDEYFYYTYKTAQLVKKYYGMNVLNLSAGFGIPHHFEKQYRNANLEKLPTPRNIQKNVRTTPLIRDFI